MPCRNCAKLLNRYLSGPHCFLGFAVNCYSHNGIHIGKLVMRQSKRQSPLYPPHSCRRKMSRIFKLLPSLFVILSAARKLVKLSCLYFVLHTIEEMLGYKLRQNASLFRAIEPEEARCLLRTSVSDVSGITPSWRRALSRAFHQCHLEIKAFHMSHVVETNVQLTARDRW